MDDERELDLLEIFKEIRRSWKKILIVCLIFALTIGVVMGVKKSKPSQTTSGTMLVIQKNSDKTTNNDKLSIDKIIPFVKSNKVLNSANNKLGLDSDEILNSSLVITGNDASNTITITCNLSDKELAKRTIIATVDSFKEVAGEIIDVKSIELVSGPSVSKEEHKLFNNIVKYGFIGGLIGFVAYGCFILCKLLFDNKVRSEDEIVKTLKAPIIGKFSEYLTKKGYSANYGSKEVSDYILNNSNKVINFITINEDKTNGLLSIVEELIKNGKKVAILDIYNSIKENKSKSLFINNKDLLKNDLLNRDKLGSLLKTNKKNYDYIIVVSKSIKESHEYVEIALKSDSNIIVVKKNSDKFDELEKLENDIELYKLNVMGIIYTNVD